MRCTHRAIRMEETDLELLTRYRQGDVGALEELVDKYRRPLFSFIINMLNRPGDADEIFQEVWFRAIKKLETYKQKNFFFGCEGRGKADLFV